MPGELEEWRSAVLEALTGEFPRELHYQKQNFIYVPAYAYIERMNDVAGEWDCEVLGLDKIEMFSKPMLIARVCVAVPGLGRRCHVGVQAAVDRMGEDAMIKGAVTDGMKKAMSLFGMGLYLSHKEEAGDLPRVANYGSRDGNPSAPANQYGTRDQRAATAATKAEFKAVCRELDISEQQADALVKTQYEKDRWSYLSEGQMRHLMGALRRGEIVAESQ